MFSGGYGYGGEDFEGRPKSGAATRREEQAMKEFQQAREQMENRGDLVAGTKHTVELLTPSCHLTGDCWKTFRRHVRSFDGWVAKRREATAEEKKQHKETRKGKVYFVYVVFNVPKEKQVLKRSVEAAQGSSKTSSSGMVFGSGGDADTSSEDARELIKKSQTNDEFLNNETIKEEILDDDEVQIVGCLPVTPMISVKTEVETESGESNERSRAGDMGSRASDMKNSSGIICDMPSAISSHSTDEFSFQPRQNVTVDRPRPSVIMETPLDTISRDGPHDHGTIGMDEPQQSIRMDHDYAKIAAEAREAVHAEEGAQFGVAREKEHRAGLEVVVPSVGVDDQVAGGGADGSRSGVIRSVDNHAQAAGGGEDESRSGVNGSVDINAQAAGGGADGSRWEGVNHSVEIQAPAQGGNRGARVYDGAWRGNDKMKIKVEIELSTAQFIEVAHVLPMLGYAANAE